MEEEAIWAGLGILEFFPAARDPLENGRNWGETGRGGPKQTSSYTRMRSLHLSLSVISVDC